MNREPHATRVTRGARRVTLLLVALACGSATATAPLTFASQQLWVRTDRGAEYYIATDPAGTLAAACVDVSGVGLWLPEAMLADIRDVQLDATAITYGIGFQQVDAHLPGRGDWEPSLELTTDAREASSREQGPRYSFVIDRRGVPYRVRRVEAQERWDAIDPASVRRAPCRPPDVAPFTYLWPDDEGFVVDTDIDRDGRIDAARLGLRRDTVALQTTIGGVAQPLIEIPMDGSRQFGVCPAEEGDPTLTLQPRTTDPLEALGEMPEGYEQCDDCHDLVVQGGPCDPIHFYWNAVSGRLAWWRA